MIGKINQYTCGVCGCTITTIDRDEGTTPFMLICIAGRNCAGKMKSHMYLVDQTLKPNFEWYKPNLASLKNRKRHLREHVALGGLLIRPIEVK